MKHLYELWDLLRRNGAQFEGDVLFWLDSYFLRRRYGRGFNIDPIIALNMVLEFLEHGEQDDIMKNMTWIIIGAWSSQFKELLSHLENVVIPLLLKKYKTPVQMEKLRIHLILAMFHKAPKFWNELWMVYIKCWENNTDGMEEFQSNLNFLEL
jgi:hypothetical protein